VAPQRNAWVETHPLAGESAATERVGEEASGARSVKLVGPKVSCRRSRVTMRMDAGEFAFDYPSLVFTGIADGHGFVTAVFGLFCLAAAVAPLAPLLRNSPAAWLLGLAPLLLIVIFGGLLYLKTSTDYFSTQAEEGSIGAQVVDLANSLTKRLLGQAAERVYIAIGGYLAFLASVYLAVQSIRGAMALRATVPH
jgi:hypothetical protein